MCGTPLWHLFFLSSIIKLLTHLIENKLVVFFLIFNHITYIEKINLKKDRKQHKQSVLDKRKGIRLKFPQQHRTY